jgi:hypothetical protein
MTKFKVLNIDQEKGHVEYEIIYNDGSKFQETRGDLSYDNSEKLGAELNDVALLMQESRDKEPHSSSAESLIGHEYEAVSPPPTEDEEVVE